jgi:hypothetical protein
MNQSSNLIAISGYSQSGKDTLGRLLVKHGYLSRPVRTLAFADPMRTVVRWFRGDIGHLRATNPEGYRADMQFVGEYLRRNVFPDVWLACAQTRYELARCSERHPVVVFTDLRYPNELDWVRSHRGQVWYVDNDRAKVINGHPSESHYDYIRESADRIWDNNGTPEDLEEAVVRLGDGWFAAGVDEDPLPGTGGPGE